MAGRSVKKKNSTAPLKKAVTLIAVFVVLLFTVLDLTGLVSFDSLLIKAGVEDKPAEHAQTEVHFYRRWSGRQHPCDITRGGYAH